MKADFPQGMISTLPELPIPSELLLEWKIANANNKFQYVLIDNYQFRSVHRQPPPTTSSLILFSYAEQ